MKRSKPDRNRDPKTEALREEGALHPNPEGVGDEAFRRDEFFDARDRVQVRYEMLRRHRVDKQAVTDVAAAFGVSRQAFYTTEAAFEERGVAGLLPRRRGPKRAHKCTDEILDFVEQWREASPEAGKKDVARVVQERFGVSMHPRSIDRAFGRRRKKKR
jgi:transposase